MINYKPRLIINEINSNNLFNDNIDEIFQNDIEENPVEQIQSLEKFLNSFRNKEFLEEDLSCIYDILSQIKMCFLSKELIEKILYNFPRILNISNHHYTFLILSHISESDIAVNSILELKILNKVDFTDFPYLPGELQVFISKTIRFILLISKDSLKFFFDVFFPYFYNYFTGNDTWRSPDLSEHLFLCSLFISLMNPIQIQKCFDVFCLFIERTEVIDIKGSLNGIISILHHNSDFILQLNKEAIFRRLQNLAFQQSLHPQLNYNFKREIFIIFEYILNFRNLPWDLKDKKMIYNIIGESIIKTFDENDNNSKIEIIILLSYGFVNSDFFLYFPLIEIIEKFLCCYDDLYLKDKTDWGITLSEFYLNLDNDSINFLFDFQNHSDILKSLFEIENKNLIEKLIQGLIRVYGLVNGIDLLEKVFSIRFKDEKDLEKMLMELK